MDVILVSAQKKPPWLCTDGQSRLRMRATHEVSEARECSASRLVPPNWLPATTGPPTKLCWTGSTSSASGYAVPANRPLAVMPFIHQWRHHFCLITVEGEGGRCSDSSVMSVFGLQHRYWGAFEFLNTSFAHKFVLQAWAALEKHDLTTKLTSCTQIHSFWWQQTNRRPYVKVLVPVFWCVSPSVHLSSGFSHWLILCITLIFSIKVENEKLGIFPKCHIN